LSLLLLLVADAAFSARLDLVLQTSRVFVRAQEERPCVPSPDNAAIVEGSYMDVSA
jgi:hypothetical protein